MNLITEVDKPVVNRTIVIYSGRFQPFHRGHYAAYQSLVSKFGSNNVYIASSDVTDSSKSPLRFKEKKEIATKMFGIPSNRFVKVSNPYAPEEILSKYDGKTTQYIAAVGEKDAQRLQGKYFKPYKGKAGYGYEEIGYVYLVPAQSDAISGTEVRKGLSNKDKEKAKKFFLKAYPKFDKDVFNMITSKLNEYGTLRGKGQAGSFNDYKADIEREKDETINTQPSSKMRPEPHPTRHETEHPSDEPDWYKRKEPYTEPQNEIYDPITQIIKNIITEDDFVEFVNGYFFEEKDNDASKMGLVHLGYNYYGKQKGGEATHKRDKDGRIIPLSDKEKQARKASSDKPKPPQAGQPVQKGQTQQGKVDTSKPTDNIDTKDKSKGEEPGAVEKEPPGKLKGTELHSDAEKNIAKEKEKQKELNKNKPAHKMSDEEAHEQIKHETHDLEHGEQKGLKLLENTQPEKHQEIIDKALNNRSFWEKFSQDTILGGWMKKKGKQLVDTAKGLGSALQHGRLGVTEDCSGAPDGPHAEERRKKREQNNTSMRAATMTEDAAARQAYLGSLDKDGNKKKKEEPKDKSKCKDVHWKDYVKKDEKGKPITKKTTVPDYETGEKPDPKGFAKNGGYFPSLSSGYVGPGGENVGSEKAFKASELDAETGYFKRDDKYYDKNGAEIDKDGNKLDKEGKPIQKTNWRGKPKTKTIEEPVYEDGLTPEQLHAAHESHHASHEQKHALIHTGLEVGAIAGSIIGAPYIKALAGIGETGAHGAKELIKHIVIDTAKHGFFEMAGADVGTATAGGNVMVAMGLGESLLLEIENNEDKQKEFFVKLLRKVMEKMKTYKMTPQQKLQSIRDYKKIKAKKEKENNKKDLKDLIKEEHYVSSTGMFSRKLTPQQKIDKLNPARAKEKSRIWHQTFAHHDPETGETENEVNMKSNNINDFVKYATKKLKLKETPKISLIDDKTFGEQKHSLGGYNPETKEIFVQSAGRLSADIIRTIAHEMVHRKQDELGLIKNVDTDGATGSPIENQANAVAGILLRNYGKRNKSIYSEDISVDVEPGDEILMGKFKNKKVKVKDIGKDNHGMPTINGKQATTFRTLNEVSAMSVGSDDQPNGAWLPKNSIRELGANDGANKKDNWFTNGGYTQTDFPIADAIFGDEDALENYIKYTDDNIPRTDFQKTKFNKGEDKISLSEYQKLAQEVLRDLYTEKQQNKILKEDGWKSVIDIVTDIINAGLTPLLVSIGVGVVGLFARSIRGIVYDIKHLINPDEIDKFTKIINKDKSFNIEVIKLLSDKGGLRNFGAPITLTKAVMKLPSFQKLWNDFAKENKLDEVKQRAIRHEMEEAIANSFKYNGNKIIKRLKSEYPDIVKDKKIDESKLLIEGGAYGHMSHPFDDMDLTFGDLKNIIKGALEGDLGVVREKTDGQALAISWKNGRLIAARNKGHLANAGANAMGIEGVASKFGGRGDLSDAYNFAMNDLNAAISSLSEKQRKKIFNEGKCFMNLEVIWPQNSNVIPYGQALLVFHNTSCYDESGTAIGADQSAARTLAGMIKQVNADVQSKYTIQGPPVTELPKNQKLSSKQGQYLSKLNKLKSEFGCSDSDTLAVYHQHWWEDFVNKSGVKLQKLEKEALVRRWAFGDKSFRLNTISDKKAQEWAIKNDKVNVAKQQKDNMKPFEEIFLGVGADVLQFMSSVLTVHPEKALRSMKDEFKTVANQVRSANNPALIDKLKDEMKRLNALGGIKSIVPIEGVVFFYNGKTYKLTGSFAALNQILGLLKFSR